MNDSASTLALVSNLQTETASKANLMMLPKQMYANLIDLHNIIWLPNFGRFFFSNMKERDEFSHYLGCVSARVTQVWVW